MACRPENGRADQFYPVTMGVLSVERLTVTRRGGRLVSGGSCTAGARAYAQRRVSVLPSPLRREMLWEDVLNKRQFNVERVFAGAGSREKRVTETKMRERERLKTASRF